MKLNHIIKSLAIAITISGSFCLSAIAQDMSTAKCETTIELSYYKKPDLTKIAVAVVKVRTNKKFVPAKNAKVNFYVKVDKELQLLTTTNTDNKGKAIIKLPKELPLDENRAFTIYAKIEKDQMYEDVDEHIRYKEANLSLNLNPFDTAHVVVAKVTEIGKDGKEIPVKDTEVKFYVQRLFGLMPADDDNTVKTNEKGEASFAYPKDIPGDTASVMVVAAKVEDNDQFGNVENKASTTWGTTLAIDANPTTRALWEPKAPLPLILTITLIFSGVWIPIFSSSFS